MDWKQKVVIANPVNKPKVNPNPLPAPGQQPEIQQPEEPEPVGHVESLVEPPRDESVYGSGWSLAQLMNEFSGR